MISISLRGEAVWAPCKRVVQREEIRAKNKAQLAIARDYLNLVG